ncbi:MAG: family 20 glycosylhydrolase [Proteobacteria bacterium]|nr:family 20 glycosylhydrolase [Pseudomonadota bacterium]
MKKLRIPRHRVNMASPFRFRSGKAMLARCLTLVTGALIGCDAPASSPAKPARQQTEAARTRQTPPAQSRDLAVIPMPRKLLAKAGGFSLTARTRVAIQGYGDPEVARVARHLAQLLNTATGFALEPRAAKAEHRDSKGTILLGLDPALEAEEGYRLTVGSTRIDLRAKRARGLFYGIQTLRQLAPVQIDSPEPLPELAWTIPAVEIEDAPRFRYRGMHLDVGRHLFPVEFIKRYIDTMARYKLNMFHWHLTEDQGWRIEIKKYPRLTEVGAWRKQTIAGHNNDVPRKFDGQRYGGFYTQEQVRDIVAYAAARFVTVMPEIELPGHSKAALAAYPELGCTKGPFEVATIWGVHEDIYCPKEKTFRFLEDVLSEVLELFPSRYIHIGGDEAPKARWKSSKLAQAVIRREGLKDEHELQSYFIRRIEKFLNSKGRRLVGWDEILEGGLAPDATVMSWPGVAGGIAAAKQGHDVIMSPTSHAYFDYYQAKDKTKEPIAIGGYLPLEKVYRFEPVPPALSSAEAERVIGGQANLWTEYIKTPSKAEYMAYPRMLALSEVVWSPKAGRDWDGFAKRVDAELRRFDLLGIDYARHVLAVKQEPELTADGRFRVALRAVRQAPIHYTLDGSQPDARSPRYEGPITLAGNATLTAVAIEAGRLLSLPRAASYSVHLATGKPVRYGRPFSPKYPAARELALTDGRRGSAVARDGLWQGFVDEDLDATLDLGQEQPIQRIEVGVLRHVRDSIVLPERVEFRVSKDGRHFSPLPEASPGQAEQRNETPLPMRFGADANGQAARYVQVVAHNHGKLPDWHRRAGKRAWLFVDEIVVR